jgi:hypothetical protein
MHVAPIYICSHLVPSYEYVFVSRHNNLSLYLFRLSSLKLNVLAFYFECGFLITLADDYLVD